MMRSFLAVLLIAGLVAPAIGQVYFGVTGDGSFNTRRAGDEGYSAAGAQGTPRMMKDNQHMGWMSFFGAQGSNGQSLADYVTAHPGVTATLYVRTSTAISGSTPLVSIRSGNQGALVEDQDASGVGTQTAPAAGFAGASENVAFRGCATAPLSNFPNFGDGLYTLEDPTSLAGTQGVPWITPSTRAANAGRTPFQVGPNQPIRYDKGIWAGGAATGKYLGYFADTPAGAGRNIWAVEDLLGLTNQKGYGDATTVTAAGQIVNGGAATPTMVSSSMYVAADPKTGTNNWLAIPIDAAFLADMALNQENKGFVFANTFAGSVADWGNVSFYAKEQSGGAYAAYLAIPEPATMILLALGGMVAIRRRK